MRKFIVGDLFLASSGEYSDYTIAGVFRVTRSFDATEQMLYWAQEIGIEVVRGGVDSGEGWVDDGLPTTPIQYIGWLSKQGFIEDIECRELHTGSYGKTRLSEDCV